MVPWKTRVSENFCPISKSWKQLWYVSKPCFQVILGLGVSNFFKARSWIFKPGCSLAKSQIYHSILLRETELFLEDIIFITVKPRSLHHVRNNNTHLIDYQTWGQQCADIFASPFPSLSISVPFYASFKKERSWIYLQIKLKTFRTDSCLFLFLTPFKMMS